MNKLKLILTASVFLAAPVFAGGDIAAGKEKSVMCAGCHGPTGNPEIGANPKLAGQHESYLLEALRQYKSGKRKDLLMGGMVASLNDDDLANLAAYFASQQSSLDRLPNKSKFAK